MLGVVLPDGPLTTRLQEFLAEQTEYKVISADQWLGMYRFSQEARSLMTHVTDYREHSLTTICSRHIPAMLGMT